MDEHVRSRFERMVGDQVQLGRTIEVGTAECVEQLLAALPSEVAADEEHTDGLVRVVRLSTRADVEVGLGRTWGEDLDPGWFDAIVEDERGARPVRPGDERRCRVEGVAVHLKLASIDKT